MPAPVPAPPLVDAAAGTPSLRTLGTGAVQACAGNDSRLTTPAAAQVTPAANKIPLADGAGHIDSDWLAAVGPGAGTYGGGGNVVTSLTLDVKGRITALTTGAGSHTIQDDGVSLTTRTKLNFKGALQAVDNSGAGSSDVDLEDLGTPGTFTYATLTVDAKGRVSSASSGVSPLGASGNTIVRVLSIADHDDNDTTNEKVVGAIALNPADYAITGSAVSWKFRAVAAAGNTTVVAKVKLRNVTDAVDVATLTFTGSSAEQKQEATLTVPGDLPNSEKVYEARIYVVAHSGGSDLITLYTAELRATNTVT